MPGQSTSAPATAVEHARLAALRRYHILDTEPEERFDQLTALAAYVCGAPIAGIGLIDEERQFFKSRHGITVCEVDRDIAFCRYVVESGQPLVVPDTLADPAFSDGPMVTGEPHVRFYVGVPLVTPDGHVLGTLCVLDTVPRELTGQQLAMLTALADQTMTQVEHRRQAEALVAEVAAHEVDRQRLAETRRVLDGILDHTDVMVYAKDLDGRYLLANESFARVAGRTVESILGRDDLELFEQAAAEDYRSNDRLVAETGEQQSFEEAARHLDGSEHIALSTKFPLLDEAGAVYAVAGVTTDVTELTVARRALAESEARWRALVEQSPVAVAVYGTDDLIFRYANPEATRLYGVERPDELVGRSYLDVVVPDRVDAFRVSLRQMLDGHVLRGLVLQVAGLDGSIRDVEANAALVTFDGRPAIQVELRDISARVAAERAVAVAYAEIARQKQFDEAVLESVNAGVLACDADGRVVVRNAAQRRMTGWRESEQTMADRAFNGRVRLIHDDGTVLARSHSPLRQALAGVELTDLPMQLGAADGDLYDVLLTSRQIRDAQDELLGAVVAFTDISSERRAQHALRESAAFHDAVLAASPDLIFVVDPRNSTTVWSSRNMMELLGYSDRDIEELGTGIVAAVAHPDDAVRLRAANAASRDLADGEVLQIRYRARHSSGDYRWLSRRVTPFTRDQGGDVTQILGVARDITDVIEIEERLREAALHDPLTGLANRTLLTDRLLSALTRSARTGDALAVLFCDLDEFKAVNDTGGHAAGDEVLRVTAERLRTALRSEDSVARVGGDEFVVIVEPAFGQGHDVHADATGVAERIQRDLAKPIECAGETYRVTVSIGIAIADAGSDVEQVLREADTAMYDAKKCGKARHEVFES